MTAAADPVRDWLVDARASALAWWIPQGAIIAAVMVPVPWRTLIWIVALVWIGTACLLNARRCGRTHCRYTGPYYLAMIVPVVALSFARGPGELTWLIFGVLIIAGGKIIWWVTERAWGKFS